MANKTPKNYMSYIKDFRLMQDKNFLSESLINEIEDKQFFDYNKKVKELYSKIACLNKKEKEKIEETLKVMTELACIKELFSMKVTINLIKNQKTEKGYIQARGAITLDKDSRIAAGYYMKILDSSELSDFSEMIKDDIFIKMAKRGTIDKLSKKLKEMNGL